MFYHVTACLVTEAKVTESKKEQSADVSGNVFSALIKASETFGLFLRHFAHMENKKLYFW